MAYVPIILRKLKYTYKGNDYDVSPFQLPYLSSIYGTDAGTPKDFLDWISDPSNAEGSNTFSFQGGDNSADGIINKGRIKAAFNASALNIQPIFAALSVGDELYFWNENVGRNVRWVWKKDSATLWRTGVYVYGTYTWGNTLAGSVTSYGWKEPAVQNVGFLHNSDNGRFHWFSCIFSSNDAEHGYNSEPVYFNEDSDYYWSAYGAALTMLCTGNWIEPATNNDPYAGTGEAAEDQLQTGPAGGNADDTSDAISVPSAPLLNLSTTDLIQAYVPDLSDIQTLANFMWGNFDKTDTSKDLSKILADPRDGIVALFMLPFSPDKSANKRQSAIGKYPVTGLQMYTLSNQFKEISCGSVTISEYYGNYLDYNPYTRLTLFLPFVGEVQLDPDEVMNETVYVDYTVDCLTGEFVAFVSTSTKVLSQYQGNCASQVPTTSADYSRLNSAMLQAAIGAVGAVAGLATGGGAVAGLAAAGAMAQGAASTALNIMNSKVNHSHSGALGGAPGFMGVQTPYLIIHRARQSVPYDANKFKGYPANANMKLSDLEGCGFTTVREIKLDNYPFTEAEAEELRTILGNGIYL